MYLRWSWKLFYDDDIKAERAVTFSIHEEKLNRLNNRGGFILQFVFLEHKVEIRDHYGRKVWGVCSWRKPTWLVDWCSIIFTLSNSAENDWQGETDRQEEEKGEAGVNYVCRDERWAIICWQQSDVEWKISHFHHNLWVFIFSSQINLQLVLLFRSFLN